MSEPCARRAARPRPTATSTASIAVALGFFGFGFLALLHPCLEGVLRAKYQGTEAHAEAENAMGAQSLKAVFG